MSKLKTVLAIVIVVSLLVLVINFMGKGGAMLGGVSVSPAEDPIDVASDLANRWITNLATSSPVSIKDFLAQEDAVTDDFRQKAEVLSVDPILCQPTTPERVGVKEIFVGSDSAQVMIIARGGEKTSRNSVVTLEVVKNQWIISDITCSSGEVAEPAGEYTFVRTGLLAKDSVPAPYDSSAWHVLYTNTEGTAGAAELLFDTGSVCMVGGVTGACDQSLWQEGVVVEVKADLQEAGALVRRIEIE